MEQAREILRRSFFELWDENYPDAGLELESELEIGPEPTDFPLEVFTHDRL